MKMLKKTFALVLSYFSIFIRADDFLDDYLVHLPNGDVRGKKVIGENGNEFYAFKGIPYAEPPVGNFRFKPPVPKKPWSHPLNAIGDGPVCPQVNPFKFSYEGKEDCLYLNVYTPKLPGKDDMLMEVMYHIHGGAFMNSAGISSLFGPRRFPLENVVLVSITYRVGVLGFLSTNDSAASGNYGLLDQAEGLRWVRNNIQYFGGNPNKVTIFGESAGGTSVIFQMLSPLVDGLFQQAIAMSGSALCNWALQKDPLYWSSKLANETNCPMESTEEMVECLRQKPAKELMTKGTALLRGVPYVTFGPTVDKFFINDSPLNIVTQGKYNKDVPLLIGTTKDEGNCFYLVRKDSPNDFTDMEIEDLIKGCVDVLPNVEEKIKLVKDKYFGGNITSYNEKEGQKTISKIITDGVFHKCIFHTAKEMAKTGTKTYLYQYDYEGPFSVSMAYGKSPDYGVCHADDLFMFFDGMFQVPAFDDASLKVKDHFQSLFINFVRHEHPTSADDEWPQSSVDKLSVYHIDQNCSVEIYDEAKDPLYKFWITDINKV